MTLIFLITPRSRQGGGRAVQRPDAAFLHRLRVSQAGRLHGVAQLKDVVKSAIKERFAGASGQALVIAPGTVPVPPQTCTGAVAR
jgi:hypothetical protein